jgi:hypothetical protein
MEAVAQTGPEIKRINVPWDATMQDAADADAGWDETSTITFVRAAAPTV